MHNQAVSLNLLDQAWSASVRQPQAGSLPNSGMKPKCVPPRLSYIYSTYSVVAYGRLCRSKCSQIWRRSSRHRPQEQLPSLSTARKVVHVDNIETVARLEKERIAALMASREQQIGEADSSVQPGSDAASPIQGQKVQISVSEDGAVQLSINAQAEHTAGKSTLGRALMLTLSPLGQTLTQQLMRYAHCQAAWRNSCDFSQTARASLPGADGVSAGGGVGKGDSIGPLPARDTGVGAALGSLISEAGRDVQQEAAAPHAEQQDTFTEAPSFKGSMRLDAAQGDTSS